MCVPKYLVQSWREWYIQECTGVCTMLSLSLVVACDHVDDGIVFDEKNNTKMPIVIFVKCDVPNSGTSIKCYAACPVQYESVPGSIVCTC